MKSTIGTFFKGISFLVVMVQCLLGIYFVWVWWGIGGIFAALVLFPITFASAILFLPFIVWWVYEAFPTGLFLLWGVQYGSLILGSALSPGEEI